MSGGIGVTPFRSMIKFATDKQLPVKIIMFDSNRNEQNILYKDEFDRWANQNKNLIDGQTKIRMSKLFIQSQKKEEEDRSLMILLQTGVESMVGLIDQCWRDI